MGAERLKLKIVLSKIGLVLVTTLRVTFVMEIYGAHIFHDIL